MTEALTHIWVNADVEVINGLSLLLTRFSHNIHITPLFKRAKAGQLGLSLF